MLVLEHVSKSYPGPVTALDDVSITVPSGQFCVLLGKSGSGKSTLLKICNGLVMPTQGRVYVDCLELKPRSLKQIRERIGTIHQQFHLVSRLPVLDNVIAGALPQISLTMAFGRWYPETLQRRACRLLADVGLQEEQLYRPASRLSGGQQQRVAIARAFMLKPKLLLADEPVASLDPETGNAVMRLVRNCSESYGTTVLCSLHQVELARMYADRIVGLREGRVVFDGKPSQLIDSNVRAIYDNA